MSSLNLCGESEEAFDFEDFLILNPQLSQPKLERPFLTQLIKPLLPKNSLRSDLQQPSKGTADYKITIGTYICISILYLFLNFAVQVVPDITYRYWYVTISKHPHPHALLIGQSMKPPNKLKIS